MLYFVRHGQTDDNINHIISGAGRDIPLNDVGILQAKNMAQKVKDLKFDLIFCSPMIRARQTLREIAKFHKDAPVFFDERLVERRHGVMEGQPVALADHLDLNHQVRHEWMETIDQMFSRVKSFLEEILEKEPNKNILVVAHNGVGVLFKCYFLGFPKSGDLTEYFVDNLDLLTFEN